MVRILDQSDSEILGTLTKNLDVYFTGILRQKAGIELGIEQELDMAYCDEAEGLGSTKFRGHPESPDHRSVCGSLT